MARQIPGWPNFLTKMIRRTDPVITGLVYQSGFSNVSGHVDVVFSNKAAGTYYNPELRGSLFNAKETIVWRR